MKLVEFSGLWTMDLLIVHRHAFHGSARNTGPVHASWLNQIEIYFSIMQRKALTPNDFNSLNALRQRLIGFQKHYERIAKPFEWKFRRADLDALLNKFQAAA
jgi:hypothetical protein